MALRMGELGPERERVAVRLGGPPPQRVTPARRRVLAALADGLLRTKSEAAKDAGVSAGVIDGLVDEGTLEVVALPPEPVARQPDPDYRNPELTGPQRMAEYGRLFAQALVGRERTAGGIRFRLRADEGVEAWVRDLAAREKACCPFFDFSVHTVGDEVHWDATVVDDDIARTILDEQAELIALQRHGQRSSEIIAQPRAQQVRVRARQPLCQRHVKSELVQHVRVAELREQLILTRAQARGASLRQFL